MTCLRFNQTITKTCRSTPGVSQLYIANYEDILSVTDNGSKVTDVISGTTASGNTPNGAFWYSVKVNKETSSFTDELLAEVANGAYIYKPSITFKLASLETDVRTVFKALSQAKLIAIVKTVDGKYYMLGKDNGLDVESGTATTGTASTDMKGMEITISGLEPEPYIEIDTTLYTISDDVATA